MNILDAISNPHLFGPWFKGPSWNRWKTVLRSLLALPAVGDDLETFKLLTGRSRWPVAPFKESWWVCGRRSGKSRIMALIGAYLGAFHDYDQYLAPGERGLVAIIAADREQAQVILRYLKAFFEIPMLKPLVAKDV